MEFVLKKEEKQNVDEIFEFLKSLNPDEQKGFKSFIDGFRFAKELEKAKLQN